MSELTDEAVEALLDRVPEFEGFLRKQASLSRDLHLSSSLHSAADWMDYLARALLDARAENARLRADAKAAQAQCCMCGKSGLSTAEDGGPECELHDGRWVCSSACWETASVLADTDGLAAVDALRKERDRFEAALGRACLVGGTTYLIEIRDRLAAELAAAQQREAVLRQIVESDDMAADLFTNDGDRADNFADRARAALSHNGRKEDL